MGRLIDADDVISLLANHHFDDSKENTDLLIHNLCKEVKSVPTAYDPDKVVAELEKRRMDALRHLRENKGTAFGRASEWVYNAWNEALEIVKGGGVR